MKRYSKFSLLVAVLCLLSLLVYAEFWYKKLPENGQVTPGSGGIKDILPFIHRPQSKEGQDTNTSPVKPEWLETERNGTKEGQDTNTSPVKPGAEVQTPSGALSKNASDKEKQIEAYYAKKLTAVASGYHQKLNSLVAAGMSEYDKVREKKEKASPISLARKYLSAGRALEAQCDAEFYPILDEYKAELEKNSFPPDAAVNAGKEYENAKAARKKQILLSAAKYVGFP
ncbi:MAG TPA: hypothetical protein DCW46_01260 [Desulfotomaculum sp.]|nr:hypothetical protein [Desulfotomaculum sp.]